jgi:hypothetical protein
MSQRTAISVTRPEYHNSRAIKSEEIPLIVHIQDNTGNSLSTKAIQRAPRPLESIDDVKSCDRFPLGVFCVSDRITNDLGGILEEVHNTKNKLLTFSRKILRTPRVSS